jgi:hypothetical protein
VFVTAHDQFALRAFEVHALDYLLKPFDRSGFRLRWAGPGNGWPGEEARMWTRGWRRCWRIAWSRANKFQDRIAVKAVGG